jgi:hypothetical protein
MRGWALARSVLRDMVVIGLALWVLAVAILHHQAARPRVNPDPLPTEQVTRAWLRANGRG